jgi:ubiquinone/menaquinone biosynthesis C-methylase UbiE
MERFKIQVPREHYYKKYDDITRFTHYFYQVDLTKKLSPSSVLEIGVGNKTVSNYLKQQGFNVTTCDFDKKLEPDYVADIKKLPFKNNSYDVVIACEILEHLPWSDFETALKELHRVTRKHVVISLPYYCMAFEGVFKAFPYGKTVNLFFRIPLFFLKAKFQGEHYWGIGRRGYSIKKIRKVLKKGFNIQKEVRPQLVSDHHFFVLEKKLFS